MGTIILFPTLIVMLISGVKVQGSDLDDSFYKKTAELVNRMAREDKLTSNQKSALNNMAGILNEKTSQTVGGQSLEQIQRNFTAVVRLSKLIEDQYQTYNSFVVHTLGLTNDNLHLTKDEFCKAVPKICDETYEIPEELKKIVTEADNTEVEELHKEDKEIVDEVKKIAAKDTTVESKKPEETTLSIEAATKIPVSKEDTHTEVHQHTHMQNDINSAEKPKSVAWTLTATIF